MIVVRDIFRLKFGKAKEATALWKQAMELLKRNGFGPGGIRLLTDLAGESFYTLVLESAYDSLTKWEQMHDTMKGNKDWKTVYDKITALTESGRREILSVIE